MNTFHSAFAEHLRNYVQLRRQLGVRFEGQEALLSAFDRYVHARHYQGPLTEELARTFAVSVASTSTTVPARRYLVVRHFAEYLAAYDPRTPRLDPKALHRGLPPAPPYIFSAEEIERLLGHALAIPQRPPVANRAVRAMIGLAASTGLRPGEVVGLDQADVDLDTGILVVRRTKFDKDRLVPVHPTTLEELRAYAVSRQQLPMVSSELAFFLNARLRRYQVQNLNYLFCRLVRRSEQLRRHAHRATFRSLRHTFAVHRLISWHRDGADVQALLPALATYMGHVHYTSTAYYLTATPELLAVAADRLTAAERRHGQTT